MSVLKLGQSIVADTLRDTAEAPKVLHGVRPYYRRRQSDGSIKVWFRSKRGQVFEVVMSADAALMLEPNKPLIFKYS